MKYISTRNGFKEFNFTEVFIKGLADDGGLFIPKKISVLSEQELLKLSKLNYKDLAKEIIFLFCNETISKDELSNIVEKSYSKFNEENVVKITDIGENKILELYHGPTLAFKDIAMQFIGHLYDHYLKDLQKKINVVVATSGDTGSAAIDAIKGKDKMNIFVLHPNNRVSLVQRKLMTTVKDKNVFNIAIDGNFDDCQNLVKSMFADNEFSNSINMSAVNSINWARIVAQTVYYFFSYFQVCQLNEKINFSVPTGNFGDVYAGYLSKKIGLPIGKLIVATNQNDILHKIISLGQMKMKKVEQTYSPSMDIQLSSNFERQIFETVNNDSEVVKKIMNYLFTHQNYVFDVNDHRNFQNIYRSTAVSNEMTIKTIKTFKDKYNYLADPHTATGLSVLYESALDHPVISLGCAHPAKFSDAIKKAIGTEPSLPKELKNILDKKEKMNIMSNNTEDIKNFILKRI